MARIIALIVAVFAFAGPASSHSWYESACCGGNDCQPVADEAVINAKEGVQVEGFGLLSYSDSRLRWSRDNANHICAQGPKLNCVYRRPMLD